MPEEWRSIPNYQGRYEASNSGRIRSWVRGGPQGTRKNPHILKQHFSKNGEGRGYWQVYLTDKDGITRHEQVGRLVLAAFSGPCPNGYEADHKNDISTDNSLENLQYLTRTQNVRKKQGVLSFREIMEVYSLSVHFSHRELSLMYGVSRPAITQHLKKWRNNVA